LSDEPTLSLELSPSRGFAAIVVTVHAAAAACVAAVYPGIAGGLVAALLLALGIFTALDRALLRHPDSVRSLLIEGPHTLGLVTADGRRSDVLAGNRRHVSRLAVIIPVRHTMRRTIVVTGDMLDVESFRRLRLWALWGRVPGTAGELFARARVSAT
jgi:uncharacterized membrane protein